jgi:hypothetical protein
VITTAVGLRLVVFVSKVHRLYTDYSTDWMGGGERGEGCHPSDLLCWLTVIWSGAPTDSLREVSTTGTFILPNDLGEGEGLS